MRFTNLSLESEQYAKARDGLRVAEIDLMHHRERIAEMRRNLPQGPVVSDDLLIEGIADLASDDETTRSVRLSELLSAPDRPLIVYHLMFGKQQSNPCPMCTMWIDGFNGIAPHVQHFYASAPRMSDDINQRDIGLLCPTWHLLDLTPSGRGDWYASLDYD